MCKELPLSRGKVTLVDAADYEWLSQWKWSYDRNGYAVRIQYWIDTQGLRRLRKFMLHREILAAPRGVQVDHINHDRLDNRRRNLRLATPLQNHVNSRPKRTSGSPYKGVWRRPSDGKWLAYITAHGRKRFLGSYDTPEAAALAYDAAAYEAWGEFAWLNFADQLTIPSARMSR